MSVQIMVPALGESVSEATVLKWFKNVGEAVEVDEPLVGNVTVCDNLDAFIAQSKEQAFTGHVDVIELFGGQAGTSKVLLRRFNAVTGENFDLITGYNMNSKACREKFWKYMEEFKPVMVVMAPPCTGLAGWKSMNRVYNYEAWHRSKRSFKPKNAP